MSIRKPADEVVPAPVPPTCPELEVSALKLSAEDESRLQSYRTTSQGCQSRDEVTKDLSVMPLHKEPEHAWLTSKFSDK
ncbi:hypothetical protein A0H81_07486 [Grifola frondosa]|uniref:Uncharacterized protein n=1 Tax=Grifola frondosa TaxID=5627 RepID=A0A1C7M6X5_GRIFR|nr:hypothetical protein A0H81_07486 [Grifola frondosa]